MTYRTRSRLGLVKRCPRKLSRAKAKQIRHAYFNRAKNQRELALEFDVAESVISRVVSGQIWGDA